MELKVEYLSINALKPYEKNAKLHSKEQIEQIKESIELFGMNDPIAIWSDNVIIEGHGRLIACKELGIDNVPVIRLDHLSDEQRRAYCLVHNKLTMNTDFDLDILSLELDEIIDIDMSDFGFDLDSLSPDGLGTDFTLDDSEKSEIVQMTFTLHEKQKELIEYAMGIVKNDITETFGNANNNGNAIYEVVRQWAELKK